MRENKPFVFLTRGPPLFVIYIKHTLYFCTFPCGVVSSERITQYDNDVPLEY